MKNDNYPTVYDKVYGDANEYFHGDELNEEKMERLNRIRELCRSVAESGERIKCSVLPFSNRSENGTVSLEFPSVLFCTDRDVLNALSEIARQSDAVVTTTLNTDGFQVTFIVHEMWSEFHYD